jgi:hypothetical protein
MTKHQTKVFGGRVDNLDKVINGINEYVKDKKNVVITFHNTVNPVSGPAVLATVKIGGTNDKVIE